MLKLINKCWICNSIVIYEILEKMYVQKITTFKLKTKTEVSLMKEFLPCECTDCLQGMFDTEWETPDDGKDERKCSSYMICNASNIKFLHSCILWLFIMWKKMKSNSTDCIDHDLI